LSADSLAIEEIAGGDRKCEVAERLIKCREASADREAGVVLRLRTQKKTTPAASASVASQHFLDDAATPYGDARRGITHQRNWCTSSSTAATVDTVETHFDVLLKSM